MLPALYHMRGAPKWCVCDAARHAICNPPETRILLVP